MSVIVIENMGAVVSVITWSRDLKSGMSFARMLAKSKGVSAAKIFVAR